MAGGENGEEGGERGNTGEQRRDLGELECVLTDEVERSATPDAQRVVLRQARRRLRHGMNPLLRLLDVLGRGRMFL